MELRPYQLEAVDGIRRKFAAGKRRTLVISPTGSGKTVLFSHIAEQATQKGAGTVLVIAHRRELVKQAADKLLENGIRPGRIQPGFRPEPHRRVQVASIQTLQARPGCVDGVKLIIVDEAHHATPSNGYGKVMGWFPEAFVLGVTATPWRLDGNGLADTFEDYVVATTPRELRDEGFLTPVGGWEYEAIDTSSARVRGGDFVVGDMAASASSAKVVGDVVSEWLQHAAGKRTVLFAISVEHSQQMVEAFRRAGVPAEHVDGQMNVHERDAITGRLKSGETLVVCNCNVFTEGFDCPAIECVILARPTLSTSLYLQQVGRGLRPACLDCGKYVHPAAESCGECGSTNVKRIARIHDHAGCLAAHGHPYMERDYSPEESATKRRSGPRDAPVWTCKQCKSVVERFPCDACGYRPPVEDKVLEAPAAARREITNDGAGNRQVDDAATRRARWERFYADDVALQHQKFLKWTGTHGLTKGVRVFWWFSGHVARPRAEWIEEARQRVQQGGLAA